jgi:hypothetical protein
MRIFLHFKRALAFASKPANWQPYALTYSLFTSALLLGILFFAGNAFESILKSISSGNFLPVMGTIASAVIALSLWLAGLALASLFADALVIKAAARAKRVRIPRVYPSLLAVSVIALAIQLGVSLFFSVFDNWGASLADSLAGALLGLSFAFAPYAAVLSGKGTIHALNKSVSIFFTRPFELVINYIFAAVATLAFAAAGLVLFAALAFTALSLNGIAFAFVGSLALFELILTVSAVQCFQKAYWVSAFATLSRSRP